MYSMEEKEVNATRAKMPLLNPKVRRNSFLEVALGYTPEQAMEEAGRCVNCDEKPCASGCPMNVNIPAFISEVAQGNFERAYEIITETNLSPAICSRVCSTNPKCERACSCKKIDGGDAVAIAALERFVADYHDLNTNSATETTEEIPTNGHKVAVIGSGPAGITCAANLAKIGYDVKIFEERATVGGILEYGTPEFRLPKTVLRREISKLESLGVEINTCSPSGHSEDAEELLATEGYDAVYVSEFAELPEKTHIRGENLMGVIDAGYYLNWVNTKEKNKYYVNAPYVKGCKTVVIGGGVRALDAARCMRRFDSEVTVIYNGTENDLEACPEEIMRAKEEDIKFLYLSDPIEFTGNSYGHVTGVLCEKLMMTVSENSNKPKLIPLYDSEFEIPADYVIVANATVNVEHSAGTQNGTGIFNFKGAATAIDAMSAGKDAAVLIDNYVRRGVRV